MIYAISFFGFCVVIAGYVVMVLPAYLKVSETLVRLLGN